jgi:hypothetical protein
VIVLPGDTAHFRWAKSGEYVTQVTPTGRKEWTATLAERARQIWPG